MGKTIQIRADESLAQILEKIRKDVAESMKREYGLNNITIFGTLASQIAAARLNGKTNFSFKIKKTGLNQGILELI
jgi:hypothetical protein